MENDEGRRGHWTVDSDGFKNTMKSMDTQVENLHTQEDVINLLQWAAERAVQEHDWIIRTVVDHIKTMFRPEGRRSPQIASGSGQCLPSPHHQETYPQGSRGTLREETKSADPGD